jgi:hypothetical protein
MAAGSRVADAQIQEAIREYVRDHPDAADSDVGVQNWWLRGELRNRSLEEVRCALDALVAAGVLVETQMPDRRIVYSGRRGLSKGG